VVESPILGVSKGQKSHRARSGKYICWGMVGIWLFGYSPKTATVGGRGVEMLCHGTDPN